MEDSTTDTEQEKEEETDKKEESVPIHAIVPTINIQDERTVDLSTTPAFICLHEVYLFLFIYYYSKTWIIVLKSQRKLIIIIKIIYYKQPVGKLCSWKHFRIIK